MMNFEKEEDLLKAIRLATNRDNRIEQISVFLFKNVCLQGYLKTASRHKVEKIVP